MSPLRDLKQAAEFLGISPDALERKVSAREVPFTRPAGLKVTRFSEQDLADIIAAGRVEPLKAETTITRPRRTRAA